MTTDDPARVERARPADAVAALRDRGDRPSRTARRRPAAAAGRVLAADVQAALTVPSAPRAASEGFAVDASATHGASARVPATVERFAPVGPGDELGPFDAVVPAADADAGGGHLTVYAPVTAGANVDPRGAVAERGDVLFEAGHRLRPTDHPLLRAAGPDRVPTRGRPRVSVADDVAALVERGGATVDSGADPDGADLVVGDRLDETLAGPVALAPGGAAAVGTVAGTPAVRLPDRSAARLVAAGRLVRPVVAWLSGAAAAPACGTATLTAKVASEPRTVTVARVALDREEDDLRATPLAVGDAVDPRALARGDAWVTVPGPREGYAAGERVAVERWDRT